MQSRQLIRSSSPVPSSVLLVLGACSKRMMLVRGYLLLDTSCAKRVRCGCCDTTRIICQSIVSDKMSELHAGVQRGRRSHHPPSCTSIVEPNTCCPFDSKAGAANAYFGSFHRVLALPTHHLRTPHSLWDYSPCAMLPHDPECRPPRTMEVKAGCWRVENVWATIPSKRNPAASYEKKKTASSGKTKNENTSDGTRHRRHNTSSPSDSVRNATKFLAEPCCSCCGGCCKSCGVRGSCFAWRRRRGLWTCLLRLVGRGGASLHNALCT